MCAALSIVCVVASVSVFTAGEARAQSTSVVPGVKIGIDFSSIPNAGELFDQVAKQASSETSSKTGVIIDGFAIVPVMKRFAFQPELAFVTKGVKLTEAANGGTLTASLRYIEFPLLARYELPVGSRTGYFLAGPTFGIKAGTSSQLDGPSATTAPDIDSAVRSFDAGVAFAFGMEFPWFSDASWKSLFEVRYTQSLRDLGVDSIIHTDSLKNRSIAVMGGIRFK